MIDNIKNPEFTQKFLGFVNPHKKAEILRYNKNIKTTANKIIGKECDSDGNVKFEGECLDGKRNGKGREFYKSGSLMFDGEYLNGKRWNGKAYSRKGILAGELKNGNGFMKEYDYESGELIFDGEYLNGERKQ